MPATGFKHTPKSLAKMRAAQIGRKHSVETRAKMSAANTGFKHSAASKAKMSAARKGRKLSAEHCAKISAVQRGRKLSAEHCAKISAVQRGRKLSAEHCAKLSAAHAIHGHARDGRYTPTYRSWKGMMHPCSNPNCVSYRHYGGRGITVCTRWRESFEAFLSDMGERPEGTSIDRINNDGNYEPGNCRWATPKQQIANQRPRKEVAA